MSYKLIVLFLIKKCFLTLCCVNIFVIEFSYLIIEMNTICFHLFRLHLKLHFCAIVNSCKIFMLLNESFFNYFVVKLVYCLIILAWFFTDLLFEQIVLIILYLVLPYDYHRLYFKFQNCLKTVLDSIKAMLDLNFWSIKLERLKKFVY